MKKINKIQKSFQTKKSIEKERPIKKQLKKLQKKGLIEEMPKECTSLRVQRKIASTLFKKPELQFLCKKKIEVLSKELEKDLNDMSPNENRYKTFVLTFLSNIERRRF